MVPTLAEQLTAPWLTSVLTEGGYLTGGRVVELGLQGFGERKGFASDLWRLRPRYEGGEGPATLIAKIPPAEQSVRAVVGAFGFFPREVRFYRELAGGLPIATPRCYFGELDSEGALGTLLLEDLGDDDGAGDDRARAEAAIDLAAQMHAHCRDDAALSTLPWLAGDAGARYQGAAMLFRARSDGFLEELGERVPVRFRERMGDVAAFIASRGEHATTPGSTLLHGDFRLDNLLFPGAGAAPVLLDWQLLGWGPGAGDIAYFLAQSLPLESRRTHEGALLARYHAALEDAGVTGYTRAQLQDDYRRGLLQASLIVVNLSGTVRETRARTAGSGDDAAEAAQMLPGLLTLFETMAERTLGAIEDSDALALLA